MNLFIFGNLLYKEILFGEECEQVFWGNRVSDMPLKKKKRKLEKPKACRVSKYSKV